MIFEKDDKYFDEEGNFNNNNKYIKIDMNKKKFTKIMQYFLKRFEFLLTQLEDLYQFSKIENEHMHDNLGYKMRDKIIFL